MLFSPQRGWTPEKGAAHSPIRYGPLRLFSHRIAKDFAKFNGGGRIRTLREQRLVTLINAACAYTYCDGLKRSVDRAPGSIGGLGQTPAAARAGYVFARRSRRSGTRLLGDNTTESLTPGGSPTQCRLNSRRMRDSASTISI